LTLDSEFRGHNDCVLQGGVFAGAVAGLIVAWELKRTDYMRLEWRVRARQQKQTRSVFFRELPRAGLAVAALIVILLLH
jgi:hypothetical protein